MDLLRKSACICGLNLLMIPSYALNYLFCGELSSENKQSRWESRLMSGSSKQQSLQTIWRLHRGLIRLLFPDIFSPFSFLYMSQYFDVEKQHPSNDDNDCISVSIIPKEINAYIQKILQNYSERSINPFCGSYLIGMSLIIVIYWTINLIIL